jgi:hypothetical protein
MVDVARRECAHPECTTQPSFSLEGDPAKFCATHAEEGMINVRSKQCAHPGCKTRANFALEGDLPEFCGTHAEEGMINVNAKQCTVDGCTTQPSFAFEGDLPEYCGTHAEEGMIDVVSKRCAVDGCKTIPSYGREGGSATHCAPHGRDLGMVDVKSKKCIKCDLFYVNITTSYLCSYCNPNTSKYQKTREMEIKALLESTTDLNNPIHDKPIGGECGKYRPDFLYDALTHFVVVEVDEDQHRAYDPECEKVRMINILGALKMRCVFVRYNPDAFHIDGKTIRVYEKKRHDLLLKTIRECMKPSFDSDTADVIYLYYDGAEVREEMLI